MYHDALRLDVKNDLIPVLMVNSPSYRKRDDGKSGSEDQVFNNR
jgi:hypothetical protein